MWNSFVSRLENDISKPRPTTCKIIRMLKNDTREQVKINPIKKGILFAIFPRLMDSKRRHIY
jgi:hypothetical protein